MLAGKQSENEGLRDAADIAGARTTLEAGDRRADRVQAGKHAAVRLERLRVLVDDDTAHGTGNAGAEWNGMKRRREIGNSLYLRVLLPAFKAPKRIVHADALPKTERGKLDRKTLAQRWKSGVAN